MRRIFFSLSAGVVFAFLVFFIKTEGAWEGIRFRLGLYDRPELEREVKQTVADFNIYYARFFSSAGEVEGLNLFPADNLIKRRVIQEINTWKEQGSALVYDRYALDITKVEVLGPTRAVVVTSENWALMLREIATGRKSRGTKTLQIQCRYLLGKSDKSWKVLEYEVFSEQDEMPHFPEAWRR